MKDRPRDYTAARAAVVVVLAVWAILLIFGPTIARWQACQELAPVERMFVRGC